ncbi:MaoC/PaaZ C-terminal domain-containing protein [Sediminicoccus sp. BL-A-41-H5]|uniref:MaoC/PaaZ C-terminal domain-containing protein n=1 Tax=Sediminicoccus sp. BL-A-41-H5 TaxID=3421106 RepID=UPI003D66EC9D
MTRLARIIRHVPDARASADFYARAFGLTEKLALGEDYIAMETGETVLGFARQGFFERETGLHLPSSHGESAQEIAFEVPDVAAAHARAMREGCAEVLAPVDKPWGQTLSYVRDLDGALVQLGSPIGALAAPLYLDDLAPGQVFRAGPVTVTAPEIMDYAARYDPQPFHTDPVAAAEHPLFRGLAASGWHTAALTMRMVVRAIGHLAGGIVGAGGELQWPRPVRPGDELRVEIEMLEVTPSRSRPDRGSAVVRITTLNQAGEAVQVFTPRMVVPRRPS